jgi:hypothetical protein
VQNILWISLVLLLRVKASITGMRAFCGSGVGDDEVVLVVLRVAVARDDSVADATGANDDSVLPFLH